MQQQKNRVEVQGNNYHFVLFKTKENANYSPEPRLCSFVAAQFETGLFLLNFPFEGIRNWSRLKENRLGMIFKFNGSLELLEVSVPAVRKGV